MRQFALLLSRPSNRVYGQHAAELALAELAVVASALHSEPRNLSKAMFGGVEYVQFESADLDEHDRIVLSNHSAVHALFEIDQDRQTFRPVDVTPIAAFNSDLITIQRYAGKTNEQFTHLLVNAALAVSDAARERSAAGLPVRLIDPVAGRGTTLNRGLMYGFDVAGIDIDSTDFDAYRSFLTTYLKDNRRSFKLEESAVRKGPQAGSKRFIVRIDKRQRLDVVRGDTAQTSAHFGARSFDLLVADLPYGVQHGSTSGGSLARAPDELVFASVTAWREVLRAGAGIALAWNVKTLPRAELATSLESAGFHVRDPGLTFEHRVDRAITRDVIVATL